MHYATRPSLDQTSRSFLALYSSCYHKHPNAVIQKEMNFIKLLTGDISGLQFTKSHSRESFNTIKPKRKTSHSQRSTHQALCKSNTLTEINFFTDLFSNLFQNKKVDTAHLLMNQSTFFLQQGTRESSSISFIAETSGKEYFCRA